MEGFALRDGVYTSSMSAGEALLLRQLATEVLVVLDDPGEYAATSSMVNAATETEQRRDEPRERTLRMLLPSMSEDDEDAGRLRALTEDSLRTDKSVRLRAIVGDLDHIVHGESDTLVVRPDEDVMVITESGKLVQVNASDVRPTTRNTMGVIFARPDEGDRIIAITRNPDSGDDSSDDSGDEVVVDSAQTASTEDLPQENTLAEMDAPTEGGNTADDTDK